ncbi:MAG: hypothetical protein ACRCXZ_07790 [Patescibacteria group bacterium]
MEFLYDVNTLFLVNFMIDLMQYKQLPESNLDTEFRVNKLKNEFFNLFKSYNRVKEAKPCVDIALANIDLDIESIHQQADKKLVYNSLTGRVNCGKQLEFEEVCGGFVGFTIQLGFLLTHLPIPNDPISAFALVLSFMPNLGFAIGVGTVALIKSPKSINGTLEEIAETYSRIVINEM